MRSRESRRRGLRTLRRLHAIVILPRKLRSDDDHLGLVQRSLDTSSTTRTSRPLTLTKSLACRRNETHSLLPPQAQNQHDSRWCFA